MHPKTRKRYKEHHERLRRIMERRDIRAPDIAAVLGVTAQYVRLAMCGRRALSASQLDLVQKHNFQGR